MFNLENQTFIYLSLLIAFSSMVFYAIDKFSMAFKSIVILTFLLIFFSIFPFKGATDVNLLNPQSILNGLNHLKYTEGWSHSGMFIKALPFTAGAIVLFLVFFQFDRTSLWQWSSYFLIFLSALSLPHIYFMSKLYNDV